MSSVTVHWSPGVFIILENSLTEHLGGHGISSWSRAKQVPLAEIEKLF